MAAIPGTVDSVIESASRRGNIPDAQMTYLVSDFLQMMHEELMAYALPILHARREDYYLEELMFMLDAPDTWIAAEPPSAALNPAWRIPDWAMAASIRDVQGVSPSGTFYLLGRTQVDDVPNMLSAAWYFYGSYLVYQQNVIASTAPPQAIRCIVHAKPNRLITTTPDAQYGLPLMILSAQATANPNEYELALASALPNDDSLYIDLCRGNGSYEVYQRRLFVTLVQGNLSLLVTIPEGSNAQFMRGDWVTVTGTTPVVPLPLEMHALLAQRVVVKFLEAQGEASQLDQARQSLTEMALQIPILLQPRAEGKPKKLAPRMGLWRRWRW